MRGTLTELGILETGILKLRKDVYFDDDDEAFEQHLDVLRRGVQTLIEQKEKAKRLEEDALRRIFEGQQQARIERV